MRRTAIVLCNPFGYEAICIHRCYYELATHLAETGYSALRFDYEGTGDSFGTDADPGRVRAWLDSIHAAISELAHLSAANEIVLFGMRLGALLALKAASERDDVSRVISWAAVSSGASFLKELKALAALDAPRSERLQARSAHDSTTWQESAGFFIGAETKADLEKLDLTSLAFSSSKSILLICRDGLARDLRTADALSTLGFEISSRSMPGYASVMTDPHRSMPAKAVFECITEWLAANTGSFSDERPDRPKPLHQVVHPDSPPVQESAVRFGLRELFGILTEPANNPSSETTSDLAAVFLNPGAIHHIGMNRMYVTMARRWAEIGVPALRFDMFGIGDSSVSGEGPDKRLYSQDVVPDILAALNHLQTQAVAARYALVGLCSGAYAAFHGALQDARVNCLMLINPQTFDYRPGDTLEVQKRTIFREARHYRRSLFRFASWAKALRGDVDFPHVLRVLFTRASAVFRGCWSRWLERLSSKPRPSPLFELLDGLCSRGCQVCLIYSADDPGLAHFDDQIGPHKRTLLAQRNFQLRIIPDADHTFTTLRSQSRLTEALENCLLEYRRRQDTPVKRGAGRSLQWRSSATYLR